MRTFISDNFAEEGPHKADKAEEAAAEAWEEEGPAAEEEEEESGVYILESPGYDEDVDTYEAPAPQSHKLRKTRGPDRAPKKGQDKPDKAQKEPCPSNRSALLLLLHPSPAHRRQRPHAPSP